MKRTASLCLSIFLLVALSFSVLPHIGQAQQETEEIALDYSFETPAARSGFQEPYQLITIPGTDHHAPPGKPVIPMKTAKILVPYGKEVEHIDVIPRHKSYLGKFYIQPGQEPIPIGDGEEKPTPPDPLIYDSTKPYPEKLFSKVGVQWKRGYQILIVNLFPVEYIPKSRKVSYFDSLKLIVGIKQAEVSNQGLLRGLPQDKELIASIVDNPETVDTYPCKPAQGSLPDRTSTGFLYPTGKEAKYDPPVEYGYDGACKYYDYAGWLARGDKGDYEAGFYHIGQDIPANVGDAVYAITGGEIVYVSVSGWGEGNYGLLVKHRLDTGEEFLALYGHVIPSSGGLRYATSGPVDPPIPIRAGEIFATIGPYDSIPHLHFGIYPGKEIPPTPWGRMPLSNWPEASQLPNDTNGFVNPIEWITTRTPYGQYDYLIITNDELKNAPEPNFQTLAHWKESRGIKTEIVTVEEIYADYTGVDEQEKIRNFIRDAYLNSGIEYVLLGGDADGADVGGESGDNIVPVRGLWAWDYECTPPNIPSDLYYACLDGSYDSNGNGIYGEPNDGPNGEDVDLLAEVYVGRAPVDSPAELSNFVTKTISYEGSTNDAYLNEVWMAGEKLAEGSDCSVEEAIHQAKVANSEGILNLLRKFRDEALKQEYVRLYYEYSPDVREILIQEPELAVQAAALIIKYAPAIEYLIGENGEDISITKGDVEKVSSFSESLQHEVNFRREAIGEQRSSELIKVLDEFKEQTRQSRGKSFSKAFQSSIYCGSGGSPMGGETWGGDYKDEIKDGSSSHGYYTEGFPDTFNKTTLYDRDYSGEDWPKSEIIDAINSNIHAINHMGHSGVTYVMKMYNSDVDGLTNDKYFLGYSQGCYAGSFDNRYYSPHADGDCGYLPYDCIVEHLVVNPTGAFAFIANSRYGFFRKDTTDGPSQYYDRQFWDAIFGEGITNIGRANQDSKEDNIGHISTGVMRFCYYEINLLGDPETQFWVPPSEHDIAVVNVDAPETVEAGVPASITATIGNKGQSDESNIEVQLLEDDVVTDTAAIDNLQPGASAEVDFTWWSDVQGEHTLKVYAPPLPEEENVANNYREHVITVVGTLRVDDDRVQCPTAEFTDIQEAIDSITSRGTVAVFPGSYGRVVINKTINLVGLGTPVIDAAGIGNAVEIQADGVTLRGFKAQNSGSDQNAGIMIGSNNNLVRGNTLVSNQAGIALNDASNNEILENTLSGNEYGIGIESYCSNNQISFNSISSNDYGVYGYSSEAASQSAVLPSTISYNNFIDNTQNAYDDMQNNKWQRNYWSNYTGEDVDGDGIGDSPYEIGGEAGAKDNYPAMSLQVIPRVSIDAPGEAATGGDFTASIDISEVMDLDSCNYDISFDASVLRLDNVTSGLIDSMPVSVDIANEISSGTWRIVQKVPGTAGVSDSGYLAVLHFHVIGSKGDSSTIGLSNGMLSNNLAEEIPAMWAGDSLNIVTTAYSIVLYPGWNLISLPLIPDDSSIDVVLADISDSVNMVRYYYNNGPEDQGWLWYRPGVAESTLTTMEDGKGYWVYMSSPATLTGTGKEMPSPPELPPTYAVAEGWNLIGFKSTADMDNDVYLGNILHDYSVLWGYEPIEGYFNVHPMNKHDVDNNGIGDMEVGHGYWLWASSRGTIVP